MDFSFAGSDGQGVLLGGHWPSNSRDAVSDWSLTHRLHLDFAEPCPTRFQSISNFLHRPQTGRFTLFTILKSTRKLGCHHRTRLQSWPLSFTGHIYHIDPTFWRLPDSLEIDSRLFIQSLITLTNFYSAIPQMGLFVCHC